MSFSDRLPLHHLSLYATFSDQTLSEGTKFCFCTPACLYVSVNQKNMQWWQLASVTQPIQTTSALTQKNPHTSSPESSLVQYQPQPNTNIHTISFSSLILHAHTRTLSHYNKRHHVVENTELLQRLSSVRECAHVGVFVHFCGMQGVLIQQSCTV